MAVLDETTIMFLGRVAAREDALGGEEMLPPPLGEGKKDELESVRAGGKGKREREDIALRQQWRKR